MITEDLSGLLPAFGDIANASVIDWNAGLDRQTLLRKAITVFAGPPRSGCSDRCWGVAAVIAWRGRVHLDDPELPGGLKILARLDGRD